MNAAAIPPIIVRAIGFGLGCMAVYTAAFGIVDEIYQRSLTVGASAVLLVFAVPLASVYQPSRAGARVALWCIDLLLAAAMIGALLWFFSVYDALESGLYDFAPEDRFVAGIGLVVILELTRRAFGWPLTILATLAIGYAAFGQNLPWIFAHAGYDSEEVLRTIWYSFDGVFGLPVIVVLTLIFIFIVFGAVLESTGAGDVLLRIAFSVTGALRGGPAHAAVAASGMFGTISGSVSANVVGTGVFTIPMIKKRGFGGNFAGGVEAAASSGGQFMPPVMGAVAFFMADITGISYLVIIVAALLPAIFYYASLFAAVDVEAARLGIEPIPKAERQKISRKDCWLALMFIVPILVIIGVLIAGRTAAMAGFWATVAGAAMGFMNPELRRRPQILLGAIARGGEQGGRIMVAVASIGIIIGVMNLTGLGIRFSTMVLSLSGDQLFLALLLMAAASLVLGMGLPTVPAYLIIVLIMGTAIEKLGVPTLLVHLFVLYYGVLSAITPPVAIAAYAAAPIAGGNPFTTALTAIRLSVVGFIVPFVFVYNPSLTLVVQFEAGAFIWVVVRLALAIWLLTTALGGVDRARLPAWSRALRAAFGVAMLAQGIEIQAAAFLAGAGLLAFERSRSRSGREIPIPLPADSSEPTNQTTDS